jgi:hypothetical protein
MTEPVPCAHASKPSTSLHRGARENNRGPIRRSAAAVALSSQGCFAPADSNQGAPTPDGCTAALDKNIIGTERTIGFGSPTRRRAVGRADGLRCSKRRLAGSRNVSGRSAPALDPAQRFPAQRRHSTASCRCLSTSVDGVALSAVCATMLPNAPMPAAGGRRSSSRGSCASGTVSRMLTRAGGHAAAQRLPEARWPSPAGSCCMR